MTYAFTIQFVNTVELLANSYFRSKSLILHSIIPQGGNNRPISLTNIDANVLNKITAKQNSRPHKKDYSTP